MYVDKKVALICCRCFVKENYFIFIFKLSNLENTNSLPICERHVEYKLHSAVIVSTKYIN